MNADRRGWAPTKFALADGRLVPNASIGPASRVVMSLVGDFYNDAINQHVHGVVADLGCGSAPLYGFYRSRVDAVLWLDWPQSLHANGALDATCDLNVGVPLRSGSVDTVIVSDVLEHLRRPSIAWAEIMRVLRPGGVVVGNVPFMYWVHEAPHDYHRYTEFALRAAVEDAGGDVVAVTPLGGSADVFADLAAKHATRVPVIGRYLARAIASLALAFGRTRLGARVRRATMHAVPLGYGFVARRPADPA